MNTNIIGEINIQGYITRTRMHDFVYNIPEENQILLGDNNFLDGLYFPNEADGNVFARVTNKPSNLCFTINLDILSNEIGNKILEILAQANTTKKYTSNTADLCAILNDMISYVQGLPEEDCFNNAYLKELSNTGLFNDAIGKVVEYGEDYVEVAEDIKIILPNK